MPGIRARSRTVQETSFLSTRRVTSQRSGQPSSRSSPDASTAGTGTSRSSHPARCDHSGPGAPGPGRPFPSTHHMKSHTARYRQSATPNRCRQQIAGETIPGCKQRDPPVATSPIPTTRRPGRNSPPVATNAIRHIFRDARRDAPGDARVGDRCGPPGRLRPRPADLRQAPCRRHPVGPPAGAGTDAAGQPASFHIPVIGANISDVATLRSHDRSPYRRAGGHGRASVGITSTSRRSENGARAARSRSLSLPADGRTRCTARRPWPGRRTSTRAGRERATAGSAGSPRRHRGPARRAAAGTGGPQQSPTRLTNRPRCVRQRGAADPHRLAGDRRRVLDRHRDSGQRQLRQVGPLADRLGLADRLSRPDPDEGAKLPVQLRDPGQVAGGRLAAVVSPVRTAAAISAAVRPVQSVMTTSST